VKYAVVALALLAQGRAVKENRLDRCDGARVEVPVIWRKEPRPSQCVAFADGLQLHCATAKSTNFFDRRFQ